MKRNLDRMMDVKKKQLEERNRRLPPENPDEVEIPMELPLHQPLNTAKSVFDEGLERRFGGINTAPSIFDRTAVFHTSKKQ